MVLEFFLVLVTFVGFALVYARRAAKVEYFPCEEDEWARCRDENNKISFLRYSRPDAILVKFETSRIVFVWNEENLDEMIRDLDKQWVIGVDVEEYRLSSYLGFVCLIQIATGSQVYLVDTLKIRRLVPRLKVIFSNSRITKIFHGCHNDTQWLQRDFGIVSVNVFDTQIAAQCLKFKKLGINELWDKFCGHVMTVQHKKKMQASRWDLRPLTSDQLNYAAQDAFYLTYIMAKLLDEMTPEHILKVRKETTEICTKRFSTEITREKTIKQLNRHKTIPLTTHTLFWYSELLKIRNKYAEQINEYPKNLIENETLVKISESKPSTFQSLETQTKTSFLSNFQKEILNLSELCKTLKNDPIKEQGENNRQKKKQERYDRFLQKYTINKKVYENCQIQAPDGEILCFTDMKKARWYVERDLAEVIIEAPYVIRLKFEPNGRGFSDVEADQLYYSKEKKNECVSCGGTSSYLKYHVVPLLYRQFFPEQYKSHRSHDVVLLCAKCHEIANKFSDQLKIIISKEFQVPLNSFTEIHKSKEELKGIRKVAQSLLKNNEKLPEDRKKYLVGQIQMFVERNSRYSQFFDGKEVMECVEVLANEQFCRKALEVFGEVNWKKELSNNHGKLVVEKVKDLKGFIRRWRVHFIETVKPKFLPDSWNVDHLLNSPKFK
jgi:ribonuclease D